MEHKTITLAHGNGGRLMRELIQGIIAEALLSPSLNLNTDAALIELPASKLVMTTDAFTVQPLEFPGGSIGTLAVNGTLNDLAVSGAKPLSLSLNVIVEEGFDIEKLQHLMKDVGKSAKQAGVEIVTGDTKVVPRGLAGGMYLVTTGVGHPIRAQNLPCLTLNSIEPGDIVLVSGAIGNHGTAVLLAREEFGLTGALQSDCANTFPLIEAIIDLQGLKFLRDPTRGGIATVAHEVAHATNLDVVLHKEIVPVAPEVESVCNMLGFDPYYLACEGRVVAVASRESAGLVLERWRALELGKSATQIGELATPVAMQPLVRLTTPLGGERVLDELENDPLPRIC